MLYRLRFYNGFYKGLQQLFNHKINTIQYKLELPVYLD